MVEQAEGRGVSHRSDRSEQVSVLMRPASIAIIGFSTKDGSGGRGALSLLEVNGFKGDIYLVGRSGGTFEERTVLASIDELPSGVDLGVIVLPAAAVADALEACVRRAMRTAVVFASGFAEMGDTEGQARIAELVERGNIGIVGPNCLGYVNYIDGLSIGFMPGLPIEKVSADNLPAVGVIAQSGGLMASLSAALAACNVPVAYRLSTGNEAGLGLQDYLAFMADDDAVSTIVIYAEQIRHPKAFLKAAAMARAKGKNVVLFHTGRGAKARKAAASHTGAMAGEYKTMATAVRRAGILLVSTLEELTDCAELMTRFPVAPTRGPAVATTSGAFCAIAHDACEDAGLELASLTPAIRERLVNRLPDYVSPTNPLDLTTVVTSDLGLMGDAAATLLEDPEVGSIVYAIPGRGPMSVKWLSGICDATVGATKPVIISVLGDEGAWRKDFEDLARARGAVISRSPERAIRAIAAITEYGRQLTIGSDDAAAPEPALEPVSGPGTLPEWQSKAVIQQLGIAIPAGALAKTPDEAAAIAARIGYPVVLKLQSADLPHKTEVGGVILGLSDEQALRAAFTELEARAASAAPAARIDGMLVEAMSQKGLELVVGATRDEAWGPVVMVGLGGIMVEALNDVRLLAADLPEDAIVAELRKLQSAPLLSNFRGKPAPDVAAVARTVAAVGRLMRARPEIAEIDINPLVAFQDGEGAVALDALVMVKG